MDAWLARMKQNGGIIPSFVDLDGTHRRRRSGRWWGNAYGWGFSPVNPVTGRREDRNRIPRALVGFSNALLVTGDQKYVDAWRAMIDAVNAHARTVDGRREYPTMCGADGWYGWRREPWSVGALEVWYWSMRPDDRARVGADPWVEFLEGQECRPIRRPRSSATSRASHASWRRSAPIATPPDKRLADNMLDANPAATDALVRLMFGALVPGREGGLLNARLRYFDPARRRAGVPEDVAALVSALGDRRTVVTLVNLSATAPRTVIVQAGGYAEHQFESVTWNGQTQPLDARHFTVRARPRRRRDAHVRDAPLRQPADGRVPVESEVTVVRATHRQSRWATRPCSPRPSGRGSPQDSLQTLAPAPLREKLRDVFADVA